MGKRSICLYCPVANFFITVEEDSSHSRSLALAAAMNSQKEVLPPTKMLRHRRHHHHHPLVMVDKIRTNLLAEDGRKMAG